MKADYWHMWDERGKDWQAIFEALDPAIRAFAARHKMQVIPWRWQEPSQTLSWREKGNNYEIRILIEGDPAKYGLELSGAVWRDVTDGEDRFRYYSPKEGIIRVFVGQAQHALSSEPELAGALESARKTISSMTPTERISLGKAPG